jgi:hypothetical protein
MMFAFSKHGDGTCRRYFRGYGVTIRNHLNTGPSVLAPCCVYDEVDVRL